jgi:primosomal protein N' (replication factor Y)
VHLLFQAPQRDVLHALLRTLPALAGELPESKRVRWSLDVDPADLF